MGRPRIRLWTLRPPGFVGTGKHALPRDFIEDVSRSAGFEVGWTGFEAEMQKQRERARASWKGAEKRTVLPAFRQLAEQQKTEFEGYRQTTSSGCKILAILKNSGTVSEAKPGENVEIVLDRTPFYAEAGGQVERYEYPDSKGLTICSNKRIHQALFNTLHKAHGDTEYGALFCPIPA